MRTEAEARIELCEVGRKLEQLGLIGGTEGNLSVRLPDGRILTTPSGKSKGSLQPSDLVVVSPEGVVEGRGVPSSELRLHLIAYEHREDCGAVVHAHPPVATGFALARKNIPTDLTPEAIIVLGPVALTDFAMPGTEEVPNSLLPFLQDHKTFLLSHHGAATLGSDLGDAFNRMVTLERIAKVMLHAEILGGAHPMPSEASLTLKQAWENGRLG